MIGNRTGHLADCIATHVYVNLYRLPCVRGITIKEDKTIHRKLGSKHKFWYIRGIVPSCYMY